MGFISGYLNGQTSKTNNSTKPLSTAVVFSFGQSTILKFQNPNQIRYQAFGEFQLTNAYFFESGISLTKRLKRNAIRTGLTIGNYIYNINGYKYSSSGGFINRSMLSDEKISEDIRIIKISIPLNYKLVTQHNFSLFEVNHEFGLITDFILGSNYEEIVSNIINRAIPFTKSLYHFQDDICFRLMYGVHVSFNSKISIGSHVKYGFFQASRVDNYWGRTTVSQNISAHPKYRYVEMGLSLYYDIK